MKKSKCKARLTSPVGLSNRGQAAIEYILLLVVSVSLLLALVYQIFEPMQKFVQANMGDYVQCLLETGALPAFGSDQQGIVTAEDVGCSPPEFANRDPKQAGSKSSSGQGSKSDPSDGSKSGSSSSSSSSSDGSSGGSGSYAGSSSRNGGRLVRNSNRAPTGVEGSAKDSRVVEIALEGNGSGGFFKTSRGGSVAAVQSRKAQPVNMAGWTEDERKKLEKKNDAGRTKVISTGEVTAPPKKIAVKKPEPKVEVKEDDQPMTIGNFIRFLFIAALIIALVIFIGGQALSMSKES